MKNIEQYTKNTYKHAPSAYVATLSDHESIVMKNNGRLYDCMFDAWLLGFEQAYRAAKNKKLDFQQ